MTKCVSNEIFYQNISALKEKQVQKDLPITLLIEDKFFRKAKTYLKHQTEKQLGIIQSEEVNITKWELMTITRKKWSYSNDSIIISDHKNVKCLSSCSF